MTIIKKKLGTPANVKYVKYADAKSGDIIVVGELMSITYVKPFSPVNSKGEKNPDVPQYLFETDEGPVILNSASDLDKILLRDASVGDVLEITFLGKEKRKNKAGVPYSAFTFDVNQLSEEAA